MIIAITGGRYVPGTKVPLRLNREQIIAFRDLLKHLGGSLWEQQPHDGKQHVIRSGHAIGTDQHIEEICTRWGIVVDPYPVDQEIDGPWPAAGHARNRRMLTSGFGADALIAFPGQKGTAGCADFASSLHLPSFFIDIDGRVEMNTYSASKVNGLRRGAPGNCELPEGWR